MKPVFVGPNPTAPATYRRDYMQYHLSESAIRATEKILGKGKTVKIERTKAGLKVLEISTKVELLDKTGQKTIE